MDEETNKTGSGLRAAGDGPLELKKGANIAARLLRLGVASLRIAAETPKDAAGRHVALQLIRSTTSAGACYEEARAAESTADFIHKLSVATKEVRESHYWLSLLPHTGWLKCDVRSLIRETTELAAILGASIRTARTHIKKP
jgi:four helix bundle protein